MNSIARWGSAISLYNFQRKYTRLRTKSKPTLELSLFPPNQDASSCAILFQSNNIRTEKHKSVFHKIAQKKQIVWKDIENLTGESLKDLWEEYRKINFTAEMTQFIKDQRRKYLGSGQQGKGKEKKDEL